MPQASIAVLLLGGLVVSHEWHQRKYEITRNHPMYGQILTRSDLSNFAHTMKIAWQRHASDVKYSRFAYLIQGEEDISALESAMWSDQSDVFVLTYRSRRDDALFFPNSLLAEGRNMLVGAAVIEEQRRGEPYMYYIFSDADAIARPTWAQALPHFESFLRDWEPAVGLPSLGAYSLMQEPEAVFNFDHIFVAVHVEAASALLPYDASLDRICAWTSQWHFSLLASALFRNHVLVLHSVVVLNPSHSTYPKDDCLPHMTKVSQSLQFGALAYAKSCFPDPVSGIIVLPDRVSHSSYLPWGTAARKKQGELCRSYANVSISSMSSCDDEVVVQTLQRKSTFSWCPSCSEVEAFVVLQTWIAEDPYRAAHWNMLGLLMLQDREWQTWWASAAACFLIAERINTLSGLDESRVSQNVMLVKDLIHSSGFDVSMFEEPLWQEDSGLGGLIVNALTVDIDGHMKVLMDPASLLEFVDFLLERSLQTQ